MPLAEGISFDLTLVWAFLIAFAVFVYVVLDGFDLGLGMLFAVEPRRRDRDVMMNSVAPVWDGNETWLILGGGGLFAAFPLAYALILPALYAPVIAMLLALIFRGVAFEFRWRTERWRGVWDLAFIGGSAMAAFAQGVTLGGLLQGIEIDEAARAYSGGWFDWLTPFSVTVGVAVMAGYMLLGATWLVMKTSDELQERMRRRAWVFGLATLAFIGVVSLWTPFLQEGYYRRWFVGLAHPARGWRRGGGAGPRGHDVPLAHDPQPRVSPVPPGVGAFRDVLRGPGDLHVPLHRADRGDAVGAAARARARSSCWWARAC